MVNVYAVQYNDFTSLVSEEYPNLFKFEIEYVQQNIFTREKMAHPMEYIKKSLLFHDDSIGSELMIIAGQLGKNLLEINSRAQHSKISESEAMNLINASLDFLKKGDNRVFDLVQNSINRVEQYPDKERFIEDINKFRFINQLKASSLARIKNNPVESVKTFHVP